jgi:hypothetical protein
MTCNDCGREISDCDRNGCREVRGVAWATHILPQRFRQPYVDATDIRSSKAWLGSAQGKGTAP